MANTSTPHSARDRPSEQPAACGNELSNLLLFREANDRSIERSCSSFHIVDLQHNIARSITESCFMRECGSMHQLAEIVFRLLLMRKVSIAYV